jgi:hypothetical protein
MQLWRKTQCIYEKKSISPWKYESSCLIDNQSFLPNQQTAFLSTRFSHSSETKRSIITIPNCTPFSHKATFVMISVSSSLILKVCMFLLVATSISVQRMLKGLPLQTEKWSSECNELHMRCKAWKNRHMWCCQASNMYLLDLAISLLYQVCMPCTITIN